VKAKERESEMSRECFFIVQQPPHDIFYFVEACVHNTLFFNPTVSKNPVQYL